MFTAVKIRNPFLQKTKVLFMGEECLWGFFHIHLRLRMPLSKRVFWFLTKTLIWTFEMHFCCLFLWCKLKKISTFFSKEQERGSNVVVCNYCFIQRFYWQRPNPDGTTVSKT